MSEPVEKKPKNNRKRNEEYYDENGNYDALQYYYKTKTPQTCECGVTVSSMTSLKSHLRSRYHIDIMKLLNRIKKLENVYVLSVEEYEDDYKLRYDDGFNSRILGVFSSKEKAEEKMMEDMVNEFNENFIFDDDYKEQVKSCCEIKEYIDDDNIDQYDIVRITNVDLFKELFKGEYVDYKIRWFINKEIVN